MASRSFELESVELIAAAPIDFGCTIHTHSRWAIAPHDIIPGSVLLLAALGFALAQRPREMT